MNWRIKLRLVVITLSVYTVGCSGGFQAAVNDIAHPDEVLAALTLTSSMVAVSDSQCVQVYSGSPLAGAKLIQNSCQAIESQKFTFTQNTDGSYQIKSDRSGFCIDSGNGASNTVLTQQVCSSTKASQKFVAIAVTADGSNAFAFKMSGTNMCLSINGNSTAVGANTVDSSCTGSPKNEVFHVTGIVASPVATSSASPNFPRLSGVYNGGTQLYGTQWRSFAAKLQLVLIGGGYEAWDPGYTRESIVSSIHSQSKVSTKVIQYMDLDTAYLPGTRIPWFTDYSNEVEKMHWWLYAAGSSGTIVPDFFSSDMGSIDMTSAVAIDPITKLSPYGWGAQFGDDFFFSGAYQSEYPNATATPDLDGIFLDNVFAQPRSNGDWLRLGKSQSYTDPSVCQSMMEGEAKFFSYMHAHRPNKLFFGNGGNSISSAIAAGHSVAPLNQIMNGSMLESAIGRHPSVNTWGGSNNLQKYYQHSMSVLESPAYLFFTHANVKPNGSDPLTFNSDGTPATWSAPYQGMRYGITASLMNDGFYFASAYGYAYTSDTTANELWFDEYNDGGHLGVGYLGQPLTTSAGAAQTGVWQNGVWKREFQNGIVLWNPSGNGARTVKLSGLGNLKHLCGTQAPTVNNCKAVTNGTVTLQDRDGLILLRY